MPSPRARAAATTPAARADQLDRGATELWLVVIVALALTQIGELPDGARRDGQAVGGTAQRRERDRAPVGEMMTNPG